MPGGSCHFWYLPVWKIGKLQMNWSEMTALKKAGESRTKLRTSKLCMVTQERGEKKQGRDFSLELKITR